MVQKVFLYIFFPALFFFGTFLIFRGGFPFKEMNTIDGKILKQSLHTSYSLKGKVRYSLVFKIDSQNDLIGIPLGDNKKKATQFDFENGKLYKFYLNPTYPSVAGINNGIQQVEHQGKTIYEKSETPSFIFGLLLSMVSLITIIYSIITFKKMRLAETAEINSG